MKTQTVLPILEKESNTYKLYIPNKLERKIRYICKNIWDVEWSGILFYKHSGSFENNNLIIECEDIYVLDIGNATYTEFEMSPEVAAYMNDNNLLDYQMGLVHSHNLMSTFFSCTDTATLQKEGNDRTHFVSLIVNNKGDYTAAITRKEQCTTYSTIKSSYFTFNDEFKSEDTKVQDTKNKIIYSMLDIVFENDNEFEDINTSINNIKETKNKINISKASDVYIPKDTIKIDSDAYPLSLPSFNEYYKDIVAYNKSFDTKENQGKLFTDEEMYYIPYESIPINDSICTLILSKLIACSATINPKNVDIETITNSNMAKLYSKTFGKGEEGIKSYKEFIEPFIEFLIYNYTKNVNIETIYNDEDSIIAIYSYNLIKKINQLTNKSNKIYMDIIIRELDRFLI